jgi:hypothetical protein
MNPAANISKDAATILPLLGGEGWGEVLQSVGTCPTRNKINNILSFHLHLFFYAAQCVQQGDAPLQTSPQGNIQKPMATTHEVYADVEIKLNHEENMKKIATILCLLSAANLTKADVIADWGFQTAPAPSTSGNYAADSGTYASSSFASGSHVSVSTVYSSPPGNGSANSYSANYWAVNDYWQLATSSSGYQNLTLKWDQGSSSTGPGSFILEYSVNGGAYATFGTIYSVNDVESGNRTTNPNLWATATPVAGTTYSVDLSSISALNNEATIAFRLVDDAGTTPSGSTVAAGGTDRIDNFIISGTLTPVPEPGTWGAVSGASLLGLCGVRVWRQRRQQNAAV